MSSGFLGPVASKTAANQSVCWSLLECMAPKSAKYVDLESMLYIGTMKGGRPGDSLHDAEGVLPRHCEDSDGEGYESVDAKADQDGAHVEPQALQQRHDVACLQDCLRNERCDANWRAVDHQINLQHS